MRSFWLAFCDCGFPSEACETVVLTSSVCPRMGEDKVACARFLMGGTGCGENQSFSGGRLLSNSLLQLYGDTWGCAPSLLVVLPGVTQFWLVRALWWG